MKASASNFPALVVSLALHCSLLLPLLSGAWAKTPAPLSALPNSVAFDGTSIEVDAPTPELAAAPGQDHEIAVEPPPASETETETEAETDHDPSPPAPATPPEPPRARPRSRTRPPEKPISSATADSTPATATPGTDAPAGPSSPGTFGAEKLAPGVRRVGYAFTHAIPPATKGDEAWQQLPAGLVGTVRVEVSVGEENRVSVVRALPPREGEPPTPPALERLVQRTALMLRAGQFALSGSNEPGKELLIIEVRLRDEPPEEDAKGVITTYDFVGATPGNPGTASFRYDSGRRFEAKVTTMPAPN